MKNSIYSKDLNLKGNITVTLDADERMMIAEAMTACADKEVDILPLMMLMDRMITGK